MDIGQNKWWEEMRKVFKEQCPEAFDQRLDVSPIIITMG